MRSMVHNASKPNSSAPRKNSLNADGGGIAPAKLPGIMRSIFAVVAIAVPYPNLSHQGGRRTAPCPPLVPSRVGLKVCKAFAGVEDIGLHQCCLARLSSKLRHRSRQTHPVEHLLLTA